MNFNYKLLLCYIMFITMILSMEKPSKEEDLDVQKMTQKYMDNPNDPDVQKEFKAFETKRLISKYVAHLAENLKVIGPYRDYVYVVNIFPDGSGVMIRRNIIDKDEWKVDRVQILDFDEFLKFPVFTLKIVDMNNANFVSELQFSNVGYDDEKKEFNIEENENDIEYHFYVEDLFPELAKQVKNSQEYQLQAQERLFQQAVEDKTRIM